MKRAAREKIITLLQQVQSPTRFMHKTEGQAAKLKTIAFSRNIGIVDSSLAPIAASWVSADISQNRVGNIRLFLRCIKWKDQEYPLLERPYDVHRSTPKIRNYGIHFVECLFSVDVADVPGF